MASTLSGQKILLGITGGIAAYKSAELCRALIREGADVRVIMSEAACEFIAPLTFEALTGKPVPVKMFRRTEGALEHISLADEADTLLVAPATADYLARCATGRASDLISAVTLAFTGKVIFAPAMNSNMWRNPATIRNIATLKTLHGWIEVPPGDGELACGWTGPGRMADVSEIVKAAIATVARPLAGRKIVVTAGPTVEDIDPVRCLTNRSSGRMGYAIAAIAATRGASVTLISGPVSISPPDGVTCIRIRSALELKQAVDREAGQADVVIMAAAVADYRPESLAPQKIKKNGDAPVTITLVPNPDILAELGTRFAGKPGPLLVGFALETENLLNAAKEKLARKKIHMIVANDASEALEKDTTRAVILDATGAAVDSGPVSKIDLAALLIDKITDQLKQ